MVATRVQTIRAGDDARLGIAIDVSIDVSIAVFIAVSINVPIHVCIYVPINVSKWAPHSVTLRMGL